MRRTILGLALLAAACGGADGDGGSPGAPSPAAGAAEALPAKAVAVARDVEWVEPEPAEGQARAEAVVGSPGNADKTTRLTMHITTLVDSRSGIAGFATALAAREVGVDERLERLGARISDTEIVIPLAGSVLFDFDRDEIRPDAVRTLEELVAVVEAYRGRPVRVEGHTDAIASDRYNQALSERRARAVGAWLAERGVAAGRLTTRGFGEGRPAADNATAAGRQRNRRVEVVIERGS